MNFQPTAEQIAINDAAAAGKSLCVIAAAGAAKTTTIKMLAPNLPQGKHLAVAFNKRIAQDLQAALPQNIVASTLNALGHRAWGAMRGKRLELEQYKMGDIVSKLMDERGLRGIDEDGSTRQWFVRAADWVRQNNLWVSTAKKPIWYTDLFQDRFDAYQDENPLDAELDEDAIYTLVEDAVAKSVELAFQGTIDFLDQIFMTTSYPSAYGTFHTIIVDEAQDLSPANHRQLMLMKPKQLIAVGDPKQAIYAFRGADSSSMENLRRSWHLNKSLDPEAISHGFAGEHVMEIFPLATSFRCPKAIVQRQLTHYPEMKAFEHNKEGEIIKHEQWELKQIPYGSAIICRNNAPLVAFAFLCLANRRGFTFLGQDMAKNLKSLIKRATGFSGKTLTKGQKSMPQSTLLDKLEVWFENERSDLLRKKRPELLAGLQDRHECARTVIKNADNLGDALDYCDQIFSSQEPGLTITSGHRSKGFEWNEVFHLDPWRIPSRFAVEAAELGDLTQLQQENNLRYVIETRTKDKLHFISLRDNIDVKGNTE